MSNWRDDIMFDSKDYSKWTAIALIHLEKIGNVEFDTIRLLNERFLISGGIEHCRSMKELKSVKELAYNRAVLAHDQLVSAGVLQHAGESTVVVNQHLLERMKEDFQKCYSIYEPPSMSAKAPWI